MTGPTDDATGPTTGRASGPATGGTPGGPAAPSKRSRRRRRRPAAPADPNARTDTGVSAAGPSPDAPEPGNSLDPPNPSAGPNPPSGSKRRRRSRRRSRSDAGESTRGEGGPQLTWLEERLSDADRRCLRTIVLLHIPPFASGREERGAPWVERRVVRDILDRHPVALVLSGHIHAYERIVRPGFEGRPVNYVVSGGAGGRFFRVADRRVEGSLLFVEEVRNFVLLELGPDGLSGRVLPVKVEGEAWRSPPSPIDAFEVSAPPAGSTCSARSPSDR